ncbi:MAG: hypothetical protein FWE55_03255, partial [Synergistaceae bacterium]|nr:hypothetical protein [Synergistaceae bacterium]
MKVNKVLWIVVGIIMFSGIFLLLFAKLDIACDFVAREAKNAAKTYLQADLNLGHISGNPLRGYMLLGTNLSKDGMEIMRADFVVARINFISLLSSPRLSTLSVGGVNMNLDSFVEELGKLPSEPSGTPFQPPVDELRLVQSRFLSKWGEVGVEDVGLRFRQNNITARVKGYVNALSVVGTLTAEINGTHATLKNADLKLGQGAVKASGQLSEELDVQGTVEGVDLAELISLWPAIESRNYAGTIRTSFKATGTWMAPVFTAAASFKGTRLAGWPVESFDGTVNYKQMRFSLDNATASVLGIPLKGGVAMAFRDSVPTVFVQLSGGAIDLASLGNLGGIKGITGNISDFAVEIKGPTDELSGTISMHFPLIGVSGVEGTEGALQIKLTGGKEAIVNGKMRFQGAASYLTGVVSDLLSGPKLDLTLKTVDLNMAGLKPIIPDAGKLDPRGNVTAEIQIKGAVLAPSLDGTLSSESLTVSGYTAHNLAVGFAYARGVFTLKESSASWSGLPVKASGTVKNVLSANPVLDINASLSMNPDILTKFVPDTAQYKLRGTVQVGVRATGAMPEPKIDLVVASQELTAMDIINAKNIRATTALIGDITKMDNADLNVTASSVSVSGLGFQDFGAHIRKTGDTINLVSASASSGQGHLSGSGKVTMPKVGAGDVNINVDMTQLDLRDLSRTGNLGADLAGTFSGKLALTGKTDAPQVTFQGGAPKIYVAGYGMENLTIGLGGNMTDLRLNGSAQIGAGKLSASGNLRPSDGTGQIDLTGAELDLAKLTESVPDLAGQVSGIFSAQFRMALSGKGTSGQGNAQAPAIRIFGMRLADVSLPLALDGVNFRFGQGAAKLNGGALSLNGSIDTHTFKYSGRLNASGVDVNALVHDLIPDLAGSITGNGAMDLAFSGNIEPQFTLGGTGQARVGSGGISGFRWLDLVSRLYGVNSIRYTEVTAPFTLETTRLILQKGSGAIAPEGDPLYKYVRVEGPVTYSGDLNLAGDGNMNFQLINAAAGGVLGAAGAVGGGNIGDILAGRGLDEILRQAVEGGSSAGRQADFRDVSFRVGGNTEKPTFSVVKVGPSNLPAAPQNSSEPERQPQNIQDTIMDRVMEGIGIPAAPSDTSEPPRTTPGASQP